MRIAVCPGSFDPITLGHVDVISRAAAMFDEVIVLVMHNSRKGGGMFSIEERMELARRSVSSLGNARVDSHDGLLADYVVAHGVQAIVKGLRAMSDFENEFQQALANRTLAPQVETMFMVSRTDYMYLSSSVVKEIASFGGDISPFVPAEILPFVTKRALNIEKDVT
ncbi:MAG: pantetheine-phosphate adenylyltransferase [Clostridia bacterium]|nr:pantetheine-phosphate adenylyltransferase [Clostridia bacterium]